MSSQHHQEFEGISELGQWRFQTGEPAGQILRYGHAVMRRLVGKESMTTGTLSGPVVSGWLFVVRHIVCTFPHKTAFRTGVVG